MSLAELARTRVSPVWFWLTQRIWNIEHAFEHAKAQRREQDTTYRIFFVLVLFSCAFVTLGFGAVGKALFSEAARGTSVSLPPPVERADLVDRNGRLLALDLLHYAAYLNNQEVWDRAETRRALLAALPRLSAQRVDKALSASRRGFLIGGLTPEEKRRLHDLGLPGLVFEPEERRVYPLGSTAAHLIGFTDTGGQGLAGAEKALNDIVRQSGAKGRSVPLSIDLRIQAALDEEMRRAGQEFRVIGGAGIVVDVHTGEILAMSSYPEFDPNEPAKAPPGNLVNRVAQTVYEPGSIMKVFTLAMGLDAGLATVDTMFDATTPLGMSGRTIRDYHAENKVMPLWMVFTKSSNIGSARLGLMAGADRMNKYFSDFGLYDAAPIELAESARPIRARQMNDNTVASMSFGHAISVSPLAMAAGMTAIFNGGEYIPLTVRKRAPNEPIERRRVISESTSRTMLDLMRLNVVKGSGRKADAPGLRVGGKTGSAEKAIGGRYERSKLVSSFAAVFPTDGPLDAPRYLVLVMLDEPKPTKDTYGYATGGWTAAPTVGRVIDRIAPFLGVTRVYAPEPSEEATPEQIAAGEH